MSNLQTTGASAEPPPGPALPGPGEDTTEGKSQTRLVLVRFVRHKLAVLSAIVLLLVVILAITSIGLGPIPGWWPLSFSALNPIVDGGRPTLSVVPQWLGGAGMALGEHPFGQDRIGRDYFAMTMRGLQNSFIVVVLVGTIATAVGVTVGGTAGYFGGRVDDVLMRLTDLVIIIPVIVLAAVVGSISGALGNAPVLGASLGLVVWTGMARLVRAEFLTLREREFVDAARVAGAGTARIIFKHILPNAVGVVIVTTTLLMAVSVLLEASLGFLGVGVQPPDVSLGRLISDNQSAFTTRPWLFWYPGLFLIVVTLCINFIGDGLRDAFDPRQTRFKPRRLGARVFPRIGARSGAKAGA